MTKTLCYYPVNTYSIKGEAMAATDNANTTDLSQAWVPVVGKSGYPQDRQWPKLEIDYFNAVGVRRYLIVKTPDGKETRVDSGFDDILPWTVFSVRYFEQPVIDLFGADDPQGFNRNYLLTQIVAKLKKDNFSKIEIKNGKGTIWSYKRVSRKRAPRPS